MEISTNQAIKPGRKPTLFPGKKGFGLSFNLTALGRVLLKEQAAAANVSIADYLHLLIKSRIGLPAVRLPASSRMTGPKGGAKSFFFGKTRGTTTAIKSTPELWQELAEQVSIAQMSRGDYIEYLLRENAGLLVSAEQNPIRIGHSEGVVIGS